MKRYDRYKTTDTPWLGEIPEHWEECRLKHRAKVVLGKMLMSTPPVGQENQYTLEKYLKSRNIGWMDLDIEEVEEMWFNKYEKDLYRLRPNDLIVNEGGDVGKIALWKETDEPHYIQNSVHKVTPTLDNPRFMMYWLYSLSKNNYFWSIVGQVSIAHLTKEKLSNTPYAIVPIAEQEGIVRYLDGKCGSIDKVIATQERRITLLGELKQSIITEAVTRGLNPAAPLRPSGIDWLGNIPQHWEVCRLKHRAKVVLGKMLMSTPPVGQEHEYTLEKYLKSRNVGWLKFDIDEVDEMWFNKYEKDLYRLRSNDLIVNEGGDVGKIALWEETDEPHYIQNSVHKITPTLDNPRFMMYWLYSLSKNNYFWSIVGQVSIAHLTKEKLSNTPYVIVPMQEQEEIVQYLEDKCARIDSAIAKARREIELLREYKQSVITEAVTGKIKVC